MTSVLEPKIEFRPIVVKTEDTTAGYLYPAIRLGERFVHRNDIISFSVSIGSSFLPSLNLTIDDSNYQFREVDLDFSTLLCTVAITHPILTERLRKFEFLVTDISSISGSENVNISGILNIPEYWKWTSWDFKGTSDKLLAEIARKSGLGMKKSTGTLNDSMNYLVTPNLKAFLEKFVPHWNLDDVSRVFVDDKLNICLENMPSEFAGPTTHIQEYSQETEEKISIPLKLSNQKFTEYRFVFFESYTVNSRHGESSVRIPKTIENLVELQEGYGKFTWKTREDSNLHENYNSKNFLHTLNRSQLGTRARMDIELTGYFHEIGVGMRIPVDIYSYDRHVAVDTQKENEDADRGSLPKGTSLDTFKVKNYTQNWYITSMEYVYFRNSVLKTKLKLIEA